MEDTKFSQLQKYKLFTCLEMLRASCAILLKQHKKVQKLLQKSSKNFV